MGPRVPHLLLDDARVLGHEVGSLAVVSRRVRLGSRFTLQAGEDPLRDALVGPPERPAPLRLDGVEAGAAHRDPQRHGVVEGPDGGARQRAAPHLHEDPVEAPSGRRQVRDHLVPEGLPTLHRQPVVAPLHREGEGPAAEGLLQAVMGGIARHPLLAGAGRDHGPEPLEALQDGPLRPGRDEDVEPPVGGPGHHGGGEGGVPA